MGKVFKRAADAREIAPYEREPLEDLSRELLAALDSDSLNLDPAAMRAALLADVRAEAESKVREAFAEGRRRGFEAGHREFLESVAGATDTLAAAAQAIRLAHDEFLASLEPQVLHLVRRIAERVLGREIRTDPDLVARTARRALQCVSDRARVTVLVHPTDLDTMRTQEVSVLEEFKSVGELVIEADENVTRGGCVVETETLHVDARLEHLLEKVFEELAD
ncbi:MAG TPA: FliH/SctL family protein [Candidatus Hydrogenedentes bacterium]|nr:FliH/SctL family protein [Candidatus Hydrogenedentota bacterium]HNT88836.1 FliH/SctL family protein [Candidatus Hydrogenedentota bacterium]